MVILLHSLKKQKSTSGIPIQLQRVQLLLHRSAI